MNTKRVLGIEDETILHGGQPFTPFAQRMIIAGKMRIGSGDVVVDIGAGTGACSLEFSRLAGTVYSVERNPVMHELIEANRLRQGADNLILLKGEAPQILTGVPGAVDSVFVGGSGGVLGLLLDWIRDHLKPGGKVVFHFVTLDHLVELKVETAERGFAPLDILMTSISHGEPGMFGYTTLTPGKPHFIVTTGLENA